jgi:hypothetical protein
MVNERLSNLTRLRLTLLVCLALGFSAIGRADVALNITPTFDSSITSDANAAAIEGTINSAINYYQNTFTTHTAAPINVSIYFKEAGGLGSSNTVLYKVGYGAFDPALHNASSGDSTDTTALAGLPLQATNPVTGSTNINGKSANLRALGFNTPGIVAPDGSLTGTFDGVIGLNTSITNPPNSPYSLFAVTEHEIDEVLGLGSDLPGGGFFNDPAPEDLFRYNSLGNRSYTAAAGFDDAWFSLDGTNRLVQFNQANATGAGGDYGDWWSNNGGGNPGSNPPARVQDAFASPGTNPTLATDAGTPEIIALDAIGYNLAQGGAVPEPSLIWLMLAGSTLLVGVSVVRGRMAARSSKAS